jgi:hypothetical protein
MSKLYKDTEYPEIVHLRPSPSTRPVRTIESVEQTGLVVDHAHAIAMYTSRSVPSIGPPGPKGDQGDPGVDENSKFDTIIASCSDETTALITGGPKTTFRAPYRLDLTTGYVRASLTTAPTGAAMIIRLTVNGTNLFTTPIQIDAGSRTSVGSVAPSVIDPALLIVPDDAEFLVYVDQVGSSVAGTGLKVAVTGIKVDP